MLEFMQDNAMQTLDCDDYYIQTEWNGADNTLHINLPTRHPQMLALQERTQIYDSEDGQVYRISKYDRGKSSLDLEAELDLDSLCAGALLNWDNRADDDGTQWMTLGETVTALLKDTGWTLDDQSGRVDVQQMETFNGTPLEAITQAVEVWGNDLGVQYDNARRVVHLVSPGQRQPTGAYLTEDLNLLEAPQVRGKAARGEYYNRLYLIGADGLMLPEPYYVEHRAENEPIVSHVETNEDITDVDTLRSTAQAQVDAAAIVSRSYTCKVADLYRLRPQEYAHLKIDLYDTVILIDRDDYSRSYQEIYRYKRYPEHPEKNEVTLGTVPGTLSATARQTFSVARDAAARAYNAKKTAVDASKVATDYIQDSGGRVTVSRPGGGASVGMGSGGLEFEGIRNQRPLWTNSDILSGASSPSDFAAQTISLDLSSYSAVLILYTTSIAGHWWSGAEDGEMTAITLPVNGLTTTMLYPYNTLTRRNVNVSATGVRFYGGYERWQDYNLGIINQFELDVPWKAGWTADNGCCIPCYIYGFM